VQEGIQRAEAAGLDLVEISPQADPPVCKILDYGKYKYELQKKKAAVRKNQKIIEIKEIKIRPTIEENDYQVKLKHMQRFFEEGDKVKVTMRFRGREMSHQEIGMELLQRMRQDLENIAKVEAEPKFEGKQIVMLLSPK
jgi:translation initiation factor IF-3